MKRYAVLLLSLAALVGGVFIGGAVVRADASAPMTEAHIARIRNNCVEAQSSLAQLHASDALLRVNRGQLYESISTKLMAPLNSRIALNKLDSSRLVSTTVAYEAALDNFRSDYQLYEQALSKVLNMNCVNQPVSFYDGVGDARTKRVKVHQDITALQKNLKEYKKEFEAFATKVEKDEK